MTATELCGPSEPAVPLILDSPHSGSVYPPDFRPARPMAQVRGAEDFAVDQLFADAVGLGVPLFKALFPRIYVDVNRAQSDIVPASVAGYLPFATEPSVKAALGKGVIWTEAPPPPERAALYAQPLTAEEVLGRLTTCWRPYREELTQLLEATRSRFGAVYYLDCHSMQSVSTAMHEEGPGLERAEIVLGDRDGTSCCAEFTAAAKDALEAEGFEVAVNEPYKGADLVRAHGRPQEGFHALQIEVRRNLYMDEKVIELSHAFGDTRMRLGRAVGRVRDWVRSQTAAS